MALSNRLGSMLSNAARKWTTPHLGCPDMSSIYRTVRWISSAKLFIGGLSYGTDDMSLREAFGKYGDIVEARIILDRDTGRSRGFGFVTFTSSEDASSAIQALDGQVLHGRTVRVNYATDRSRGFGGGGGYGAGGGGYGGGGGGYGGGGYGGGGYGGGGYGGGGVGNYGNTGGDIGGGGGYDQKGYGGGGGGGFGDSSSNFGGSEVGGKAERGNIDDMPIAGNDTGDFGTGEEDNYLDDDDDGDDDGEAYNRKS